MPVWTTKIVIDKEYGTEAVAMIDAAQRTVRILAYSWRWYPDEPEAEVQQINAAIMRAITRGCEVRALCSSVEMALVLQKYGIRAKSCDEARTVHAKVVCTDEAQIMLGSHNITKRALHENYEMSMLTKEYEPVAQFITYFDKLWDTARAN